MPPAYPHPQPRRIAAAHPSPALLALFALLALPRLATAWGNTMDPVFVFYPRNFCRGDQIALEVWDRDEQRWAKHPRHPVIPVDSCQLEDAGVLLNEIRWRCLERGQSDWDEGWSVGVRVFESSVMQRCDVARTGSGFGETEIHVSTPKPGETIADADGKVEIEGSVWIGGLAGAEYDVVIAIDTSNAQTDGDAAAADSAPGDPLSAQVRAARRFVDSIRDRLGEVRIGIVSFPGPDVSRSASTGKPEELSAKRELPLTGDAAAIERALKRVADRGRAGPMSFSDGFALAVDELYRPPSWPGAARPGARRIVMLSADGRGGYPFGQGAQADRDFRERNVDRARSAALRGVALHLFALGGISEQPPAFIDEMLANTASSFTRVPSPDLETFFAERVSMPYLEKISIHNAGVDREIGRLSFTPDGRFAASVPLAPGENHLTVRARISDGDERESLLVVEFDASAYQDHLLALEAARIRRARSKHLVLEVEE
ncbi:MAG: VWA domain-containing protein [Deltaproteobacteria bacterium]|jgi:hypothetical protein|nr:VWA domain-containing protein [Deltaproteobacteria bacterium]MBW2540663.1 VWA domain-containing protein [Deltaproteobacteria bacterium]